MTKLITPKKYYGFKPGTDRKLARWDKIVEYFWHLDAESDRIKVTEEGKSTMGHPMLVTYISSPENLANLNKIKKASWDISHPEGISKARIKKIIAEGKVVVGMTMSIHASEVGGTQVVSDFVYELLTREDPLIQRIRENVLLVLFPCANPDGQIMTVDYYKENLGTEFEGGGMPWLYHKYVGHDNNRDALTLTQVETQIMNRVILKEWFPQAFMDHHQMGYYGARFFVPPASNPVDEVADPLVWTEQKHYGAQMAIRMESAGIEGVEQATTYPGEFMPGISLVVPWFNICGMFTETASVKVATPVYVHYHQLMRDLRGRPEYRPSINFNNPWKGGWWHLKDILKGQMTASMALLEVAANHRRMILENMHTKVTRSAEKGKTEAPFAFIFPTDQADPNTTYRFLKTLSDMTVEIHRAEKPFQVGAVSYPKGSYVVFADQTARPFLIRMLSRTHYRGDNPYVRMPNGAPMMTYDFATQTMAEFKGINIIEADEVPDGRFKKVEPVAPKGELLGEAKKGYIFDCRINDSFKAVNQLNRLGFKTRRYTEPIKIGTETYPAGTFHVVGDMKKLRKVARDTHLKFIPLNKSIKAKSSDVKPLKIALYQRYWGGNMDEGWTRWLLEQFDFEYTTVMDEEVNAGLDDYDVLILPSDPPALITGEKVEEHYERLFRGALPTPVLPEKYRSGIGKDGVKKVKEFIENGGSVITLHDACEFALEKLGIPLKNTLKGKDPKQYHNPGSTIWVNIDNQHPLGYGMPEKGLILLRGNHSYVVKRGYKNDDCTIVVSYPEENMMQSGWLIGERHLARRSALIEAKKKKGKVILYGFQPQNRALTDATFKLFFNALVG